MKEPSRNPLNQKVSKIPELILINQRPQGPQKLSKYHREVQHARHLKRDLIRTK